MFFSVLGHLRRSGSLHSTIDFFDRGILFFETLLLMLLLGRLSGSSLKIHWDRLFRAVPFE